ncbi:MAG: anti-sigma factor antagonist [Desulfonatronovibrio sp. MSAO_Bac4]|nr:MAG: anti-sigma factor antagonist [Desulfonatronovibrio sp. MSAO_Bac4]
MSENGQDIVLTLEEDVIAAKSEDIKQKLKETIAGELSFLTLDLDKVEQVDSVGMGVLIATYNSLRKREVGFKLINVGQNIYELFQVMRLNKHFEIELKEQ